MPQDTMRASGPFCARTGAHGERREITRQIFIISCDVNHRGIVGAILELGYENTPGIFSSHFFQRLTQPFVGRDSAGYADIFDACLLYSLFQFVEEDRNDALLYRRTDI